MPLQPAARAHCRIAYIRAPHHELCGRIHRLSRDGYQSLAISASKLPAKAVKASVLLSMTSRLASLSPSMSSITDPTSQLATTICSIDYDALDSATVAAVKRLISDGIAVAIAGTGEAAP